MLPRHALGGSGGTWHKSSHMHARCHLFMICQHHWERVLTYNVLDEILSYHALGGWGGLGHMSWHTHAHCHVSMTCQCHWERVLSLSILDKMLSLHALGGWGGNTPFPFLFINLIFSSLFVRHFMNKFIINLIRHPLLLLHPLFLYIYVISSFFSSFVQMFF